MLNTSPPLLIFFLYFFFLLGSRVTVFWDHMTISQFCPLPLPMCSFPHGVASPAQFRPALWMPPALPRPPRRTTPPPPSQVHYGLKVHQSQEAEQQHVHTESKAETCHPPGTNGRWRHDLLSCLPCSSSNMASNTAFLSGVVEPMKDPPKPELLKQYCVPFARPVFHKA